jgi:MoxR-like ATPase
VSATPEPVLQQFSQKRADMLSQLRRIIVGQGEVLEQILAAIFTGGVGVGA